MSKMRQNISFDVEVLVELKRQSKLMKEPNISGYVNEICKTHIQNSVPYLKMKAKHHAGEMHRLKEKIDRIVGGELEQMEEINVKAARDKIRIANLRIQ